MIRFSQLLNEGKMRGRFHPSNVPTYSLTSPADLRSALASTRYNELRGKLFDNKVIVWDAETHTHVEYTQQFGPGGINLVLIADGNHLIIQHSGATQQLKSPILTRVTAGMEVEWEFLY